MILSWVPIGFLPRLGGPQKGSAESGVILPWVQIGFPLESGVCLADPREALQWAMGFCLGFRLSSCLSLAYVSRCPRDVLQEAVGCT